MPRDLVVGNGTILVNLDRNLNIRDLYYPHVGLHNHVNGHVNRVGVWVDGLFAWIDDTWQVELGYRPRSLTTDVRATNGRLGVCLRFSDAVHPELNLFLRRVSVENLQTTEREIRLFLHHDFRIYETEIGDTAFFHPESCAMIHFKRDCHILMNGRTSSEGIFEYAAGVKEFGGAEGTWRDAEDGSLSKHPIEQGSVDSTISFRLRVPGSSAVASGEGSDSVSCWIALGRSLDEVVGLNALASSSFEGLMAESEKYWTSWVEKAAALDGDLRKEHALADLYERSLLTLETQIDRSGGILAANDTDIMQTARAHYSYVWPRDGAFVAHSMDMAGCARPMKRFLSFCASILPLDRSFFLQKYCPDGSLGAVWHPWIVDGQPDVPCQQDSTALVIWAAGKHFDRWKDKDFLYSIYEDLITPAVDYMVEHLDKETKLPPPSYDLWEQRRGLHLFTCSAVYGALHAACKLARTFDPEKLDRYHVARDAVKRAVVERFYDLRLQRFVRSLIPEEIGVRSQESEARSQKSEAGSSETDHSSLLTPHSSLLTLRPDPRIDASMAGVFLFGLLPPEDDRVVATMQAIYDRLWVRTPVGGIARYEDDFYFRASSDVKHIPGNPWFVTTLWMADWYIAVAKRIRDLEPALDILNWAARNASEAGLLPEQVHPFTGKPLSVIPLTWSHAAYVTTILNYQAKVAKLVARKADRT